MIRKIGLGCGGTVILALALLFLYLYIMSFRNGAVDSPTDFSESALLANPPKAISEPLTITAATFNIQDLWIVGRRRPERMRAIGRVLTELDPDVVGFQEAFIDGDREILLEALAGSRLRHHRYFPSGTSGSGLLIASAYPIAEAWFHRFTVSNAWWRVWEGDFWAGKGAALARLQLPEDRGCIDFYTTHAQAKYHKSSYRAIGTQQMAELARFVKKTHTPTAPAILTGDFNCREGNPDYKTLTDALPLRRLMKGIKPSIDNIFAVGDGHYSFEAEETVVLENGVDSQDRELRLSDHDGYLSRIRIVPTGSRT